MCLGWPRPETRSPTRPPRRSAASLLRLTIAEGLVASFTFVKSPPGVVGHAIDPQPDPRHGCAMSRPRTLLGAVYLVIAAVALIATWRQNIGFMFERELDFAHGFVEFWPALLANRATISISVDLFLMALAGMIWMVLEARRIGLRWVWLYVFFGITVAISVTFPLFLYARERKLAQEPSATLVEVLALAVLTLSTLGLGLWSTTWSGAP